MDKLAKGPPDPVQQKLRSDKKAWSLEVKKFVDDIFAIKDVFNGRPSKFHTEKSSIKDPIPGDPANILSMMAAKFQEIVQNGNNIVQKQIDYSKNRRKKQPKQPKQMMPAVTPNLPASPASVELPTNPPDLSKQLGASRFYNLMSTASAKMESGYVFIDNNIFPTLLAISTEEQAKGLMDESWPPPVMSFVYAKPTVNKFWMSNTVSPLDIIFCCDGRVSQICKGNPLSTSVIGEDQLSDLVIEFPRGTVESSDIRIGQKVGLVKPTVDELKIIIAKKSR